MTFFGGLANSLCTVIIDVELEILEILIIQVQLIGSLQQAWPDFHDVFYHTLTSVCSEVMLVEFLKHSRDLFFCLKQKTRITKEFYIIL